MDESLAARLADDLDGTFEEMVLSQQDRLYGLALRYTGSPSDAEELAQDAFVRAYRALGQYEAPRVRELQLGPWLATILLNLCRNHRQAVARRPVGAEPTMEPAEDRRHTPEAHVDRREDVERWAGLVASLPARHRAVVLLRYLDGMSYPEMAVVLDRPEGTVKAQVHRGLVQLRAAFEADERRLSSLEFAVGPTGRTSSISRRITKPGRGPSRPIPLEATS
jgi:RNA polymerase sigma-70 factor (ECF subfamily)